MTRWAGIGVSAGLFALLLLIGAVLSPMTSDSDCRYYSQHATDC